MKISAMALTMLLSGTLAYGDSELPALNHTVTVCLESGAMDTTTVLHAKMLTSRVFSQIGVPIVWHSMSRKCMADAIHVRLTEATPPSLKPGAFAYALPYEGVHIRVFCDRIHAIAGPLEGIVLAHVLAHEITHILQGIKRHSAEGLMKATWDSTDYFHMKEKALEFTPEDIRLIYLGLAARQHPAMVAPNTAQNSAMAGQ